MVVMVVVVVEVMEEQRGKDTRGRCLPPGPDPTPGHTSHGSSGTFGEDHGTG